MFRISKFQSIINFNVITQVYQLLNLAIFSMKIKKCLIKSNSVNEIKFALLTMSSNCTKFVNFKYQIHKDNANQEVAKIRF